MTMQPDCIFCKIVAGQIPANKLYEDDELLAFADIHPAAPVHVLVVPKAHRVNLDDSQEAADQALLGRLLQTAPKIAREQGATDGYRVVINNGPGGGQEVFHLHMHILAGPRPWKRL
ncbi:MAG TPA: histidine triad nucleotide-binding protein [Burkholderiaceae bacterium]|nr:histidine triad nucleotide-binding protein [Burkholderiaceae bacterium]